MTLLNAKLTWAIALGAIAMLGVCNRPAQAQSGPQSGGTVYTTVSTPTTERYEVSPGRYENQWVQPVYATAFDAAGRPFTYVAQPGYSKQVYIEPVYGYRPCASQTVYVQQTAYCPPPPVPYVPGPVVYTAAPTVVYTSQPIVYAPAPVVCAPAPVVYCPPPQPVCTPVVYCPPPRPAVSISFGFISGGGCFPPPRCEPVFRPRPFCPPPRPVCFEPRRSYSSGTSVNVNVNVRSRR